MSCSAPLNRRPRSTGRVAAYEVAVLHPRQLAEAAIRATRRERRNAQETATRMEGAPYATRCTRP